MLHSPKRHSFGPDPFARPADLPLRLYGTVEESIVDGPGLRFAIFVQGCPHRCPGCHNPLSHDPEGGTLSSTSALWDRIIALPHLTGITFSGGEPFAQPAPLAELGQAARNRGLHVMTYSGYPYETLLEMAKTEDSVHRLLSATNYLVDGPYLEAKRDLTLKFRGSSNQRILDVTCYPNSKNPRDLTAGSNAIF